MNDFPSLILSSMKIDGHKIEAAFVHKLYDKAVIRIIIEYHIYNDRMKNWALASSIIAPFHSRLTPELEYKLIRLLRAHITDDLAHKAMNCGGRLL
jgi:hypothetical protein